MLAAVTVFGAWSGWMHSRETSAAHRAVIDAKIPRSLAIAASPTPSPVPPDAVKYVDVATKDLFTTDRNPTVIVPPPPVEKPKVMPPLPRVYGVLGLPGGTKAMMAERAGQSVRTVSVGDQVGEFELTRLDHDNVAFKWDGKEIQKKVEELMDRQQTDAPGAAAPGPAGPFASPNAQLSLQSRQMGAEVGSPGKPEKACLPGDNTPAGTIVDGYRKVLSQMPIINATVCRWVPVQ